MKMTRQGFSSRAAVWLLALWIGQGLFVPVQAQPATGISRGDEVLRRWLQRRHKAELLALEAQLQAKLEALTRINEDLTRRLKRAQPRCGCPES